MTDFLGWSRLWYLFSAAVLLSPLGCTDDCVDRVINEAIAPDGLHKAVVFERDCGATTAPSTQVSILPANVKAPSGIGNALVTQRNLAVSISWASPTSVTLGVEIGTQVVSKHRSVGGIAVVVQ
jgi:hypothetical protein